MTNSGVVVVAPLVGRGEREGEDKRGIDSLRRRAGLAFSGKANLIFLKLSGVSARVLVLPVRFPGQLPRGGGVAALSRRWPTYRRRCSVGNSRPPSPRAVITEIFFLQIVLSGKPTEGNEGPARRSRLPGALRMRCVRGGGSGASGGWRMRGGARRGAAGRACAEGRASPCGVPGARSAAVLRCGLRGPVGAMVSVPVSFPAAGGSAGESGPAVRGGRVPLRRPGG